MTKIELIARCSAVRAWICKGEEEGMTKIELIAVGKDKIYSVGAIKTSKEGDVYLIYKIAGDFHLSRHTGGETHWKSKEIPFGPSIRKGKPIEDFKGIEFLGTHAFGLNSLPELYKEYKMKKNNGIFAFDMREYENEYFNMSVAILTKEGLPQLYENWKEHRKRQIYLYTENDPMLAITIISSRNKDSGK